MSWVVNFSKLAKKQLKSLDKQAQTRILDFLEDRIGRSVDPRLSGKPLAGTFSGLWRYRVGDYRIICQIEDEKLVVLVVAVGHRREIYR